MRKFIIFFILTYLAITLFFIPSNLHADIRMPLEVKIKYADTPQLGQPVKILISVKPLENGDSLKIKLIIPYKNIEAITKSYEIYNNPIKDQTYILPVELQIPDGKVYQIIADGFLSIGNQTYSDSCIMNIDLGKPELPQYPLIKTYTKDGTVVIGVVGKIIDKPIKPTTVTGSTNPTGTINTNSTGNNYIRGK